MVAKEAAKRNITIKEVIMEKGILKKDALRRVMDKNNLVPSRKQRKRR